MKKWEFLEIMSSTQKRFVGHCLSRQVIDAGYEGWELVTIIVDKKHSSEERWIFKRPVNLKGNNE